MKHIITTPLDFDPPQVTPRINPNVVWNILFIVNLILLAATVLFMPLFFLGVLFFFLLAPLNFVSALLALYTQIKHKKEYGHTLAYITLCLLYVFVLFSGNGPLFFGPFMMFSFITAAPIILSGFLLFILHRMKRTFGVKWFS
ncbi:MAG: hypothetical protein AAF193_04850 [Bacteroidota bacterium]